MAEHKSRREFLKSLGLGAAALPLGLGTASRATAAEAPRKKNIIIILTDQQRDIQWFPPGWEKRNLPAMTFLKQHGMTFTQAVNNTCACTPSRVSIFTGKYPSRHLSNFTLTEFYQPTNATSTPFNIPEENNTNVPTAGPYPQSLSFTETQLDGTLPNLATVLAEAGYDTYYKGKFHLCKGVLGYDNYQYDPDVTRFGFQQWDPPDAGQDAQIVNYGGGTADNDGRYTGDAVAFLQDRVDHPENYDRPFCLVFSLINPHDVLGYPNNWISPTNNGGYTAEDLLGKIGLPPTIHENLLKNYKPFCQQSWLSLMGVLQGPQRKNYLNFYGNLMKLVDNQIMELLNVLNAPGGRSLWRDTLIVRTSDHGEMGLTHGGSRQKWFNAYQETIRIPMVWSNPEMFPTPMESNSLVTLVDILPTLASFAGISDLTPYEFQGYNITPLFTNPSAKVQDYTYFLNTDLKAGQNVAIAAVPPNNVAMVRDAQYKYVKYYANAAKDQEEFYNLATDVDPDSGEPVELKNKSVWAKKQGAPWKVRPYEETKRSELTALLNTALSTGVLSSPGRWIFPLPMNPRAKVVDNAWGSAVAATPQVYQIICYSQCTYTYTLQIFSGGDWTDVPSTTSLISTTLAGNNGAILFQAQPTLPQQPEYRVVRLDAKGQETIEEVEWVDYTLA